MDSWNRGILNIKNIGQSMIAKAEGYENKLPVTNYPLYPFFFNSTVQMLYLLACRYDNNVYYQWRAMFSTVLRGQYLLANSWISMSLHR